MRTRSQRQTIRATHLSIATAILGIFALQCGSSSSELSSLEDPEPLSACSLVVTQNSYDGSNYWGTIKIKNTGSTSVKGYTVTFDVPSNAHCTSDAVPSGATLSTSANHCKLVWSNATVAAGASVTFNYSTTSMSFSAASNVVVGSASCSGADAGAAHDSGSQPDASTGGGGWQGLRVSGTGFVDSAGHEVIPRGLAPGEWRNIESYMLNVDTPDVKGLGETKLRAALTTAMGQTNADQFFKRWEANVVTPDDVAKWASWGVNSIRLPINHRSISSAAGTYIEAGFKEIDELIAWCKAEHIYVILDLHAAPGAQNCEQMSDSQDGVAHLWTEPTKYRQWTIDLWKTIAKRYASDTTVAGYDIFDEPYQVESNGSFPGGDSKLRNMYLDITSAIRSVDPHHILFFEGTNWSSEDALYDLLPAWDEQMAWSFHKYWDKNDAAALAPYLKLRNDSHRPVWNGETGENTYAWNKGMISLLEANKIGWNMWTYKKVDPSSNGDGGDATEPYGIVEPPNYAKMKTYLQGGAMPSQSEATTIMMALAANAATSKCVYNAGYMKSVFNK